MKLAVLTRDYIQVTVETLSYAFIDVSLNMRCYILLKQQVYAKISNASKWGMGTVPLAQDQCSL